MTSFLLLTPRLATSPLVLELGHNTNSHRLVWLPARSGEQALLCVRRLTILRCSPPLSRPLSLLSLSSHFSCVLLSLPLPLSLSLSESLSLSRCLSVTHALILLPDYWPFCFPPAPPRFSLLTVYPPPIILNLTISPPIESTNYPRRPVPSRSSCVNEYVMLIIAITLLANLSGAISSTTRYRINLTRPM